MSPLSGVCACEPGNALSTPRVSLRPTSHAHDQLPLCAVAAVIRAHSGNELFVCEAGFARRAQQSLWRND